MTTIAHCVYPGCGWKYTELDPPSSLRLVEAEWAIKDHLNRVHPGWTFDELHRLNEERKATMSSAVDKDLRLVMLAALAWLHEHDYPGSHAVLMDAEIDRAELAKAIDAVSEKAEGR